MEYRIRPYYKSELAQAYVPDICPNAALNRLALWIKTNTRLTEALKETNYRTTQRMFTSRQVALIFEYLREDYPEARVVGHRDLPGVKKDCPCYVIQTPSSAEGLHPRG